MTKTVRHDTRLVVAGVPWPKQRVVTLSGYGARYRHYDGPNGPAKYAEHAERNRLSYPYAQVSHNRHNGVVWLDAVPVVIAATRTPQPAPVAVEVGEVVYVESATPGEGGYYRIEAPRGIDGDSCRFLPTDRPATRPCTGPCPYEAQHPLGADLCAYAEDGTVKAGCEDEIVPANG